jgi:hypothetical protein
MKQEFLFIRGLKHADHTVFGVTSEKNPDYKGQKKYWDNQFNQQVSYSSGQQVKRQIIEDILRNLNEDPTPITFYFEGKEKMKELEVTSPANPNFTDQLLTGWMVATSKETAGAGRTIKRRSPLSISAMRPLHPLLSNLDKENVSFDRSDRPDIHKVVVYEKKGGKILTDEEIAEALSGSDRSLRRKWIQDNKRTSGLFIYDICIDLRTLFSVTTNQLEPELTLETIGKLREENWIDSKNTFGPCLVAPKEMRDKIIPALAKAIINWRITTNQSRTFSLMETLAIATSDNANRIAGAIRAKLIPGLEKQRATPIIDDTAKADLFIALPCDGYIEDVHGTATALDDAEQHIIDYLNSYDYEKQEFKA